jgi:prephenate dehydratase
VRPRVAYQGEPGAFAEEAVRAFFADPDAIAVPTWRGVFEAVRDRSVDAGVVPIENSHAGTIRENHDLLYEFHDDGIRIHGETSVLVRLALLALPGQRLEDIGRVYSHPQALAQADAFLRTRSWQVLTTYNTAGAAKLIAERAEQGGAAIASPRVAPIYGLDILADDVQTGRDERTRFAVVACAPLPAPWPRPGTALGAPRTTIVFAVRNVPGSLHRSLGAFAARGLNLSRLESRPWIGRGARWEYVFWVDLDADPAEPPAAEALDALRAETELVRVLGTYPRPSDRGGRGHAPDDVRARGVDLLEGLGEVVRVAPRELGDRIDPRRLEEVRVLGADARQPHQVRVVDPLEEPAFVDPARLREQPPPRTGATLLQQVVRGPHARLAQLAGQDRPDPFDVLDVHGRLP